MKTPRNASQLFYRLYKKGLIQTEIARRFKISQTRVSQCLKMLPYWKHDGRRGWTPERRALAVKLYTHGLTLEQVAEKLHSNNHRTSDALRQAGVKIRPCFQFPTGATNIAWKGGERLDKDGYVLIRMPSHPQAVHGYVRKHRLVMEQKLGRPLKRHEVVHHKNKNKKDNRPSNLSLFSSNAAHLASELKHHCPKWTAKGRNRLEQVWRNFKKKKTWLLGHAAKQRLIKHVR